MKHVYHITPYLVAALLLMVGFISCRNKEHKDSMSVKPIVIDRFDQVLPAYIDENDTTASALFREQYAPFFSIYCRKILGLSDAPTYQKGLKKFLSHETIAPLYADVQSQFSTDTAWQQELQSAFAHYAKEFQGEPHPRILTHVSGLNQSIVTVDTILSISLDCYLGKEYPLYAQYYHAYELALHQSNRIAIDAAEVWLRTRYPYQSKRNALLDRMVYEGKILLALTRLFPEKDIFQLLGYTPQQAQWAQANEAEAWQQIVGKKHLFNTESMLISKYIDPAPFVAALHSEAPGRLGRWIGYQIVKEYVGNKGVSVQSLFGTIDNAGDILSGSKYQE